MRSSIFVGFRRASALAFRSRTRRSSDLRQQLPREGLDLAERGWSKDHHHSFSSEHTDGALETDSRAARNSECSGSESCKRGRRLSILVVVEGTKALEHAKRYARFQVDRDSEEALPGVVIWQSSKLAIARELDWFDALGPVTRMPSVDCMSGRLREEHGGTPPERRALDWAEPKAAEAQSPAAPRAERNVITTKAATRFWRLSTLGLADVLGISSLLGRCGRLVSRLASQASSGTHVRAPCGPYALG